MNVSRLTMSSSKNGVRIALWVMACFLLSNAHAADLTFNQTRPLPDGIPVHQGYGDRIDSMGDTGFRYGGTNGLTSHVTVSYGPAGAAPSLWSTGYGTLSSVLYKGDESTPTLEVTLTADPGWIVVLNKFDLAAFAADFAALPVTVSQVAVLDGGGATLFSSTNQAVSGTTSTGIAFTAATAPRGESLTIRLDLTNLLSVPGGSRGGHNASDGIGIDNIRFSEEGGPLPIAEGLAVATASGPARLAFGDLDRDGNDDLVIASAGGVTWSGNLGQRVGFGLQRSIHEETAATGVAVADLDRDGDLDVLASWGTAGRIVWYENLGGDFGDPTTNGRLIPSVAGASSVVTADFDKDGDLDVLATGDLSGSVEWLANDGSPADGGWTSHTISPLVSGARYSAVADLDRDGDLDVLVASQAGPVFSWYENLGGGDFGNPVTNQRVFPGSFTDGRWIGAADLNRDGAPDVVIASCDADTLAWYPNALRTPTADFGPAQSISTTASCPAAVSTTNFDRDGDLDVLATGDGPVELYRNTNGTGVFVTGVALPGAAAFGADVIVGDPDRDGDGDVVVAAVSGTVTVFENRTHHYSFTFPIATDVQSSIRAGAYSGLALADVDADGDTEVIGAEKLGNNFTVHVAARTNTGSYVDLSAFTVPGNPYELIGADIDGDGDQDIVAATAFEASWFANLDGAGHFDGTQLTIGTGGGGAIDSIDVADLDRDGDLDVVTDKRFPGALTWFENDGTPGDGGWVERPLGTFGEPFADNPVVEDLDQDGSPDVAAIFLHNILQEGILWFRGDASSHPAQFTAQPEIPVVSPLSG